MKLLNQTIEINGIQIEIKEIDEPLFYGISSTEPSTTYVSIHIREGIHILSLYIRTFPHEFHPSHFQRFIEKFLTDPSYRIQYLQPGYSNWEDVIPIRDSSGVHFQCRQIIKSLNQKDTLQFKELTKLKTFGKDSFSTMNLEALKDIIPLSFYELVFEKIKDELMIVESLRWIARGLNASHAIYKVIADKEVEENKKKNTKK